MNSMGTDTSLFQNLHIFNEVWTVDASGEVWMMKAHKNTKKYFTNLPSADLFYLHATEGVRVTPLQALSWHSTDTLTAESACEPSATFCTFHDSITFKNAGEADGWWFIRRVPPKSSCACSVFLLLFSLPQLKFSPVSLWGLLLPPHKGWQWIEKNERKKITRSTDTL